MNIPKITKRFETSLASSLSAAGTTFTTVSATDDDGNALSGLYPVSIDVGSADVEDAIATVSGTTWTIVYRGIDADAPNTEVSANKKAHRRGAPVVITDYPIMGILRNILNGEETLPNLLKYASGLVPVAPDDLTDKAYVDGLLTGIVTTVNVLAPGTAGETVAAGNLIYFDDTDNEWKKCDADTAATVENTLLGIAQGAGTDGNAISGGVMLRGLDANQSGLTAGALYYASNTAGGISASPGTKEVTVGFSYSTTQLYFNPRFNQQLTEDEQDALVGTSGSPSSSNKFVTEADVSSAAVSGKVVRASGTALPALSGASLTNVLHTVKVGNTTRTGDTASGTQNIAHGLGVIPKRVRIIATKHQSNIESYGEILYDGSTAYGPYNVILASTSISGAGTVLTIVDDVALTNKQEAVVTFDATNIILTWTKTGTPNSGTITLIWEAIT